MTTQLPSLFDDLVRVEILLWNGVDAAVQQAHGVPLAWIEVVQVVAETPGCRVLDIAEALSITVGGASKVVDRVEAAGFCIRRPNPADRRSQLVTLTRTGQRLLRQGSVTRAKVLQDLIGSAVPARELESTAAVLRGLRRHLSSSPAEPAAS